MVHKTYTMTAINVLIINCTLKKSPHKSNTQLLADKVMDEYEALGASTESLRMADYEVNRGTKTDEGKGDQWRQILAKIKACDICVLAAPIWMGHSPSTVQQIFERLDDVFYNEDLQDKKTGQFFAYNKVAGALVTGNEDGAHEVARHILWGMQEIGFTIPPNANSYWVGMAGGSADYGDGEGDKHYYTNKNNLYMVHNTVYLAQLLKNNPIPTNIKQLDEQAKKVSKRYMVKSKK